MSSQDHYERAPNGSPLACKGCLYRSAGEPKCHDNCEHPKAVNCATAYVFEDDEQCNWGEWYEDA
jgi:hypothetical protein